MTSPSSATELGKEARSPVSKSSMLIATLHLAVLWEPLDHCSVWKKKRDHFTARWDFPFSIFCDFSPRYPRLWFLAKFQMLKIF